MFAFKIFFSSVDVNIIIPACILHQETRVDVRFCFSSYQ